MIAKALSKCKKSKNGGNKMKKKWMALVLATAMTISLVGCGNTNTNTPAEETPATETETEAPTEEAPAEGTIENLTPAGQVVIGTSTETNGDVTPHWTNSASDYDVFKMINLNIVEITKEEDFVFSEYTFANVEETENEDKSKTWTFTLQPDLKWSNGEALTAKDFVFSALFWNSKVANIDLEATSGMLVGQYLKGFDAYFAGETDVLEGVHLLGDDKFSLTVDAKYLPFYYGKNLIGMVDPYYMDGWLPEDISIEETEGGAKFVGNFTAEHIKETVEKERWQPTACAGPYVMENYDKGSYSYALKVNPYFKGNYEGKKANIENIVYKYVAQDTMMDQIKTGGVDLLLQATDGKEIDAGLDMVDAGTHNYLNYSRNGYGQLIFKCNVGPTQFVEVRQAIAMLLDRNEFTKTFTGGHGSVVHGPYGLSQWMVEEAEDQIGTLSTYNYNKDEAVKLLETGGWTKDKDGNDYTGEGLRHKEVDGKFMPLKIEWCSSESNSVSDLLVTMLANNPDVKSAGMEITQHVVTFAELLDAYYTDKGNYNMFNMGEGFSVPYDVKQQYEIDGGFNYNRINDEELSNLAEEMNYVEEGDDEAYLELWFKFIQKWNELLPNVPLYSNDYHDFFTTKLVGYENKNEIWDTAREILYAHMEE